MRYFYIFFIYLNLYCLFRFFPDGFFAGLIAVLGVMFVNSILWMAYDYQVSIDNGN